MKKIKNLSAIITLGAALLAPVASRAMVNKLDLHGTGKKTEVLLPFEYWSEGQKNQKIAYELVCERCGKDYQVAGNNKLVPVVGPLQPCMLVGVLGEKEFMVFHLHASNSVDCLVSRVKRKFKGLDSKKLSVNIFATVDQAKRGVGGEEAQCDRVASICKAFVEKCSISREKIFTSIFSLSVHDGNKWRYRYSSSFLGKYARAEVYIAVNISGSTMQFFSVDPREINLFNCPKDRKDGEIIDEKRYSDAYDNYFKKFDLDSNDQRNLPFGFYRLF